MTPTLSLKPNGIYRVDFLDSTGTRRRLSLNTRDKQSAKRKMWDTIQAHEESLKQGGSCDTPRSRQRAAGVTMNDLFDRAEKTVWHPDNAKSQGTIRSNLKVLRPLIGDAQVGEVTYTKLEELTETLKQKGYAPATVKRKMDMVSKALRMATKWSDAAGRPLLIAKPTMPSIRVANTKERVLELDEEELVLSAIARRKDREPGRQWWRFEVLLRFLLDTGARLSEALNTGPQHISYMEGQAYVTFPRYRTKSDKPRTVPLTAAVVAGLGTIAAHTGRRRGEPSETYFPITQGTAWYMWDNIRRDLRELGCDLSDVTLHTLRHTCLTRLARGGLDLMRLQKWAGHSDPKITADRYVHLMPSNLTGGVDILSAIQPSTPANHVIVVSTETGAK